jgi:hypothetical protein
MRGRRFIAVLACTSPHASAGLLVDLRTDLRRPPISNEVVVEVTSCVRAKGPRSGVNGGELGGAAAREKPTAFRRETR